MKLHEIHPSDQLRNQYLRYRDTVGLWVEASNGFEPRFDNGVVDFRRRKVFYEFDPTKKDFTPFPFPVTGIDTLMLRDRKINAWSDLPTVNNENDIRVLNISMCDVPEDFSGLRVNSWAAYIGVKHEFSASIDPVFSCGAQEISFHYRSQDGETDLFEISNTKDRKFRIADWRTDETEIHIANDIFEVQQWLIENGFDHLA